LATEILHETFDSSGTKMEALAYETLFATFGANNYHTLAVYKMAGGFIIHATKYTPFYILLHLEWELVTE